MTNQQYIEQQTKDCRERWFKDHKATVLLNRPEVIIIEWRNPTSWAYACRFIIHRQWLCVVGDIGEATFQWGQDITLEFLASLDFGYFLSKCRASDSGREFEKWDNTVAEHYRQQHIDEISGTHESERGKIEKAALQILQDNDATSSDQWESVAREIYDETGDAELASSISDRGKVPSAHAIGMFVGLQIAIKRLKQPA